MKKRGFGELEIAVLNVLKTEKRVTVKEVYQLLGSKDKYNTIMTVMFRLAKKGVLDRIRVGLQYQYWLKETLPMLIKKKLMGIRPREMICYLFESPEAVSDEEIEQMEKLLEKIKQEKAKQK